MEIIAQKRTELGKKTKTLRKANKLPGVVYGEGMVSLPITVDAIKFQKVLEEAGETNLVDVKVEGGKNLKVLIDEVQMHHISGHPIHVNFRKVNLKEKITADIPVEVVGDDVCPIVKNDEGVVLILKQTIEIEALPTDLIDAFIIDISEFTEVGQAFTMGELQFDKEKITIVDFDEEEPLVKIDYATMEEEEEEIDEEAAMEAIEATEEKGKTSDEEDDSDDSKE